MMPVARPTWARALHKEMGSVPGEGGYRKLFPIKSAAEEREQLSSETASPRAAGYPGGA